MPPPRILVIVVNWNKKPALDAMLASLRASTDMSFDTVVVDNASTDGSVEMVREKYPWAHVEQNLENLGGTGGFLRGMRYGLNHGEYDFFWLLDNDVLVHPGAMEGLVATMASDPKIAIAGSTILLMHDPNHVQEAGVRISWRDGGLHRQHEGSLDAMRGAGAYDVDYVAACSLMARVKAVRVVGVWDPCYFVFWDDMDWGVRMKRAGWRVVATEHSLVRHESYDNRRSASSFVSSYLWNRNAFYFFSQFCPWPDRVFFFLRAFRLTLSSADNYELDGYPDRAIAARLSVEHFMQGVSGPPPDNVVQMRPTEPPRHKLPMQAARHVKRIALLAENNPDLLRASYELLTREFPDALIDTIVLHDSPELMRAFPRERYANITTFSHRMMLAGTLPLRYDAVAGLSFCQRYVFETFVPIQIRVFPDGTWTAKTRHFTEIVRLFARRLGVFFSAVNLGMRAAFRRPVPVDYHDFSEERYVTFSSDGESHWSHCPGPIHFKNTRRLGRLLAHGILVPLAAISMVAVLIILPIFGFADRLRQR